MLELYHYEPYANSMKCMLCLKEKGLEFTSHYVDILKFEQHEPWFIKLNPNAQVPVLLHDGQPLIESTVINEYLDDAFPEVPLRPAEPVERARMRVWSKWVDEILMPNVSLIGWQKRFRPLFQDYDKVEFEQRMERIPLQEMRVKWRTMAGAGFSEAQQDEARRKIQWFLARMEESLAENRWLAGNSYSLADINAYPNVEGVTRLYGEVWNEKDTPRSIEWLARINDRPAARAAFAMSRFKNAPGQARDTQKGQRAIAS